MAPRTGIRHTVHHQSLGAGPNRILSPGLQANKKMQEDYQHICSKNNIVNNGATSPQADRVRIETTRQWRWHLLTFMSSLRGGLEVMADAIRPSG